jgi:G3E family GTPase
MEPDRRMPLHVLTGFLGSGKTTLLKAWLADPALADTAVIINELGEIALDHLLVTEVGEGAVVLRNGCVCCSIRTDLQQALHDLQARRAEGSVPSFARVVLETTGLADPMPVVATLAADPVLRHQFRLGRVVTTVDAVNGLAQLSSQPESVKQVAIADRLVMTKSDLVENRTGRERLAALRRRLERLNPAAPVLDAQAGAQVESILGSGVEDDRDREAEVAHWLAAEARPHDHDGQLGHGHRAHGDGVATLCLRVPGPLDWTAFGIWLTMLLNRHGDRVLRVKALLNVAGSPAPVVIHGVQQIVHPPVHLARWPDADRDSRLVFILRGLDPALIERSLKAFLGLGATAARTAA